MRYGQTSEKRNWELFRDCTLIVIKLKGKLYHIYLKHRPDQWQSTFYIIKSSQVKRIYAIHQQEGQQSCAFYLHEINKHKILFHPLRISKLCEFNSNKFETKANLQLYVKLQTSSCNRLDRNGPVNFAMLN